MYSKAIDEKRGYECEGEKRGVNWSIWIEDMKGRIARIKSQSQEEKVTRWWC